MMSTKYGERWAQGIVLQWLNQVIKDQKLPFRRADQEVQIKTSHGLVRYPDIFMNNEKFIIDICWKNIQIARISVE